MSTCLENIKVFKNTLWMCDSFYEKETKEAMKNTEVIINGASLLREKGNKAQSIRVIHKGSVQTIEVAK